LPGTVAIILHAKHSQTAYPRTKLEGSQNVHVSNLRKEAVLKEERDFVIPSYLTYLLTYGQDKLIALSIAAQKFPEYFRKAYLAGISEEDLLLQLVWIVISGHRSGLHPDRLDSRGPRLTIFFPAPNNTSGWIVLTQLVLVKVTPKAPFTDTGAFGLVEAASLQFKCGPLLKAALSEESLYRAKPLHAVSIRSEKSCVLLLNCLMDSPLPED
jgi:hypothetical protein